jgi:hypothetical protein
MATVPTDIAGTLKHMHTQPAGFMYVGIAGIAVAVVALHTVLRAYLEVALYARDNRRTYMRTPLAPAVAGLVTSATHGHVAVVTVTVSVQGVTVIAEHDVLLVDVRHSYRNAAVEFAEDTRLAPERQLSTRIVPT